jgi:hypothetical protein
MFLYYYFSSNRIGVKSIIIISFGLIVLSGFFLAFVDIADSAARKAFPGYYGVLVACVIVVTFLNENSLFKRKDL